MAGELTPITTYDMPIIDPELCLIISVITSEAVTIGEAGYQTSSGTFGVADANAAGKQQFRGIYLRAAAAGDVVPLLIRGPVSCYDVSAATPEVPLYLSDTAGDIATSTGTLTVVCGRVYTLSDGTNAVWIEAQWTTIWA